LASINLVSSKIDSFFGGAELLSTDLCVAILFVVGLNFVEDGVGCR
jgi:hypothetical protein